MADKDAVTKEYMRDNEIFADAFNFLIYGGRQIIKPENLKEVDTTETAVMYDNDGKAYPVQKYRDLLKSATVMSDGKVIYLLLGIENQSDINNIVTIKNMMYDAVQYSRQADMISKAHRRNNDKPSNSAEFLSGFYEGDKLTPVLTLTFYFGADEWTGPTDLHSMLDADEDILKLVDNYHLHLITPAALKDKDFDKFHTELSAVLKFIKYSRNLPKLSNILQTDPAYKNISLSGAGLIGTMTGRKTGFKNADDKEGVDMRNIWDELEYEAKAKGKAEGKVEGRAEGKLETLKKVIENMLKGHFSIEQISEFTGISADDVKAIANGESVSIV